MSRTLGNAVSKIVTKRTEQQIQADLMNKQWHDIKHRIDGILTSGNILKTEDVKTLCQAMDTMDLAERILHIEANFGAQYLRLVEPLIHQLSAIEKASGK